MSLSFGEVLSYVVWPCNVSFQDFFRLQLSFPPSGVLWTKKQEPTKFIVMHKSFQTSSRQQYLQYETEEGSAAACKTAGRSCLLFPAWNDLVVSAAVMLTKTQAFWSTLKQRTCEERKTGIVHVHDPWSNGTPMAAGNNFQCKSSKASSEKTRLDFHCFLAKELGTKQPPGLPE